MPIENVCLYVNVALVRVTPNFRYNNAKRINRQCSIFVPNSKVAATQDLGNYIKAHSWGDQTMIK